MNLEILEARENPLLDREEIIAVIKGVKTTPSRNEIIEKIAALKMSKKEDVALNKIEHVFGSDVVRVFINIYKTKKGKKLERGERDFLRTGEKTKKEKKEKKGEKEAPKQKEEEPKKEETKKS